MMLNIGLKTGISGINGLKSTNPTILTICVLNSHAKTIQDLFDPYSFLSKSLRFTF